MGLFTQLVTLPLAPVRGVAWVMDRVLEAAEDEYYDPTPIRLQLADLESQLNAGEIDEETFDRVEDQLLDRLDEIRAYQQGVPP
ncbi:gas vesicle protein GvpG [Streptomyces aureus]|uniref:gas vesicle protein GvpG n=1 Tax=Streptomyces aureus TaxID=193461 RepID=UPI0005663816|nr:gas vesicle protein GvpG [Streptomyces aureus]